MKDEGLLGYAYFENELVVLIGKTHRTQRGKGRHKQYYYHFDDGRIKHSSLINKLSENEIRVLKRDKKLKQLGL